MSSDFLSHFEELRRRLLICLAVFSAASIVCYFFSSHLLEFFTTPLRRHDEVRLFFQKPYEAFVTHLKVAAVTGLVISSPVLFTQLWLFISPGLYPREKKIILPLILISLALFLFGIFFAFVLVIPWGLHFLLSYQSETLKPLLAVGPYLSFLIGMLFAFGIFFDFPVFVIGLVKLGVLKTSTLEQARRAIIVIIFILAAVLTPSPDPASQVLLALPLVLLFEASLFVAKQLEKGRRAGH